MKIALITGITGQDGAYLSKFLLSKGYQIFGFYRRTSSPNFWRLLSLGILDKINLIPGDMTDMASISNAITLAEPDEVYNLAAQSFVGTSFEQPLLTANVDGIGVVMLLEVIKQINPQIKLYHASTSELFGNVKEDEALSEVSLDETSLFWPVSPYAASKLFSFHQVRIYREAYGMFAVNGILFNHESPIRGLEFLTRKVSNAAVRIKLGLQDKLYLGNLIPKRDWGYASEYVEVMHLMLQKDKPGDYVVATGESHSVQEFVESTFNFLDLNWRDHVIVSDKLKRPLEVNYLRGDASKARKELGWYSKTTFLQLAELMVKKDLERWKNWQKGKIFPWDALNDPMLY